MFFSNSKLKARVVELEKELSSFHETEADLREEMIFFSLDSNGIILEANELFLTACGYEKSELIGRNIKEIIV